MNEYFKWLNHLKVAISDARQALDEIIFEVEQKEAMLPKTLEKCTIINEHLTAIEKILGQTSEH